ncbi:hypothetical protein BOX15_Mlig002940g1 [Macrostomum lignano]|uniref:Coronin n=1 Tax=Macrostomum lignano TaxID=282301 RepID=A0A267DVX1_9PLAT|nr:hypothetical protein BOX15_Mlig002940g1 [Macrostomum lignano]
MAAFANRFRQSKFKHVFGKPAKRDMCYDNIRITKSSWDSTFCAVNPRYIAIITDAAGGGAFIVLPLSQYGRVERDPPLVTGHKAAVLDIQWCPHDDDCIASASEDCTAKVWRIGAESFSSGFLTDPYRDLVGHNRRVGLVVWHPTVHMVLLTAGADNKVLIWNVDEQSILCDIDFPDVVHSCSFNWTGSLFVCSCKDKMGRVINARTGEIVAEQKLHEGAKPQQVVFLRDGRVFSTGFSRMSERQWGLWDGNSLELIDRQELDSSNGVLFPFYDPDVNMIYLVGKGDSAIRYFEVTEDAPYFHFLSMYQSSDPQRGMGWMPKRGLDVSTCEIARLYKLHQRGLCEPISFTVPRKSELFQDDLYPDTCTDAYALSVSDWLSGKDSEPVLQSMRPSNDGNALHPAPPKPLVAAAVTSSASSPAAASPAVTSVPAAQAKVQQQQHSSTAENHQHYAGDAVEHPKPHHQSQLAAAVAADSVGTERLLTDRSAAASAAAEAASTAATEAEEAAEAANAAAKAATEAAVGLPSGEQLAQLLEDMRKMKIIIKGHERRIRTLEERLKASTASAGTALVNERQQQDESDT